jgi:outer membrane protein insertion porin family
LAVLGVKLGALALAALLLPSAASAQGAGGTSSSTTAGVDLDFDAEPARDGAREPSEPGARRGAAVVEAIELVGNDKTDDAVILRHVLVRPSDPVDDDLVEESRLRLLGTGYFSRVDFALRRGSARGLVVLVIEVEERNTLMLDGLVIGFSDVVPFFAGLGVAESNFLGKGMSLSLRGVAGKDRRALELALSFPDVSSTRLQLGLTLRRVDGVELVSMDDAERRTTSYSRTGGNVGVGLRFGPGAVTLGYRLESVFSPRLASLDPALLREAPSVQFDQSIVSTLGVTYVRDTRDDSFVPTSGGRVELAVELGSRIIASTYEFSRYTADLEIAWNPVLAHALRLRAFGGLIQGRAPFFDQFFVRDFSHFSLGTQALPRILGVNFSSFNDYDDLVLDVGVDYAIPIISRTSGVYRAYLYGAVDLAITGSLDELQQDPSGRGLGGRFPLSLDVGVRLDTVLGHFSLSAAYVLDLVL